MKVRQDFALLVVDKPAGPTSHDVVQMVRSRTEIPKVGHTGTLDPRATGVLVLCLGRATRLSEFLTGSDKTYRATIRFGEATTTYDADGEVTGGSGRAPAQAEIERALDAFRGEIEQVPPAFSAVRVGGKRAYQMARGGRPPRLEARSVTVHRLELLGYEPPDLRVEVRCSAGTYLRALAHDLGQAVGTGAHLLALRRTAAGAFSLDQAVAMAELERALTEGSWPNLLVAPAAGLAHWPSVSVSGEELRAVRHGRSLPAASQAEGLATAVDPEGRLVAILEGTEDGRAWHPRKVFVDG